MNTRIISLILLIVLCPASAGHTASNKASDRKKFLVVSSYHSEYPWSQETNEGFSAAMLKFGYFDNKGQIAKYTKSDYVETSKAIIKKMWMDTKRKKSKEDKARATIKITEIARKFKPDLLFLGDDNVADYIGNQFLDSDIPIVFWGVNNTPVKYGLVDSVNKPGHNVTGVYQSGYYIESLKLLKKLAPGIKTFAVLADDTPSGRSHLKKIEFFARRGILPLKLVESVSISNYGLWKKKALELQKKVDAFYIAQLSGLKDEKGNHVPVKEVARWYITHINIPETSRGSFVKLGILCSAYDSGYNQGFNAVVIADDILANGADPAVYPPRAPERGALMVNRQRAGILGIKLTEEMGIEEYIEKAFALNDK